ncbi:MAG: kelch repeat-containing protein, partial [Candidatus Competibacteraceae bacterium]|nr:kelch repeat-containing protein [Candidatus Competibacteraceae bacterium]
GRVFPLVEGYNPATGSWATRAPMSTARALHGATAANGKIYVMGGAFDSFTTYSSMEIYDPVSNSWSAGPDMPLGKFSLSASTLDNRIYAIGGTYSLGSLNHVAAFDLGSRTWSEVAPMNTRRVRFASAVAGNLVYAIGGTTVFGGQNHVGMDLVERYNPVSESNNFVINAGLADAWFNPLTNGQGFLITVFPQIGQMFVAWFTYDTERPKDDVEAILGDPGHRWLTAQGPYAGDTATLTIYVTEGGVFDATDPPANNDGIGDGTMSIEFAGCTEGLVTYEIPSLGLSGEIPIQRITEDNVVLCETLVDQ